MFDLEFSYSFYPVGQGLFSSGMLRLGDDPGKKFRWVYDCGTLSGGDFIDKGIKMFEEEGGGCDVIDLLVLSHFDRDHINGVVKILAKFKVGMLILPYMNLEQRLLIAFKEGIDPDDDLFDFYIHPVKYLVDRSIGGDGIKKIILVPRSEYDGPDYPSQPSEEGEIFTLDVPSEDLPDDEERIFLASEKEGLDVYLLKKSSTVRVVGAFWEFIPYNQDLGVEIGDEFKNDVVRLRSSLLLGENKEIRDKSLNDLKEKYAESFGGLKDGNNRISLFLYSGPIYVDGIVVGLYDCSSDFSVGDAASGCGSSNSGSIERNLEQHASIRPIVKNVLDLKIGYLRKCAIVYSGDGFLKEEEELKNLVDYFNEGRMANIGVFQVMHHGSDKNWHKGLALKIGPEFSVFSSDPMHYGHPHADVLRDFKKHHPIRVDKKKGFSVRGFMTTYGLGFLRYFQKTYNAKRPS